MILTVHVDGNPSTQPLPHKLITHHLSMKAVANHRLTWAKDAVLEWLEGPEGREVLIKALRDLADRTDTKLDDKSVELVVKGLENI